MGFLVGKESEPYESHYYCRVFFHTETAKNTLGKMFGPYFFHFLPQIVASAIFNGVLRKKMKHFHDTIIKRKKIFF